MKLARAISRTIIALTLLLGSVAAFGGPAQEEQITYNSHVAKVMKENCVVCHREGGIGPMQFENYEQIREHLHNRVDGALSIRHVRMYKEIRDHGSGANVRNRALSDTCACRNCVATISRTNVVTRVTF